MRHKWYFHSRVHLNTLYAIEHKLYGLFLIVFVNYSEKEQWNSKNFHGFSNVSSQIIPLKLNQTMSNNISSRAVGRLERLVFCIIEPQDGIIFALGKPQKEKAQK